jgi:hypothetical protein
MIPADQFQVHFRQLFDYVPRPLVLADQIRHRFLTPSDVTSSRASVQIHRQMNLYMFLPGFADAALASASDLRLNQGAAHEISNAVQLSQQSVALLLKMNSV